MGADVFFNIGKTHKVCEDYAVCGLTPDEKHPYAIVSDGCSSSKNTDIGSRIICKSLESMFHFYNANPHVPGQLLPLENALIYMQVKAEEILDSFKGIIDGQALDCTSLAIHRYDQEFHVIAAGDGVIAAKRHDGTLEIKVIEFAGNAPIYMGYVLNPERLEMLKKMYDCTKRIYTHINGKPADVMVSNEIAEYFVYPISEYQMVAVMTDGVLSFRQLTDSLTSRTSEAVPVTEIVHNLMDFKGLVGEFVHRRCSKFLSECIGKNRFHTDDFAIGVVTAQ